MQMVRISQLTNTICTRWVGKDFTIISNNHTDPKETIKIHYTISDTYTALVED